MTTGFSLLDVTQASSEYLNLFCFQDLQRPHLLLLQEPGLLVSPDDQKHFFPGQPILDSRSPDSEAEEARLGPVPGL